MFLERKFRKRRHVPEPERAISRAFLGSRTEITMVSRHQRQRNWREYLVHAGLEDRISPIDQLFYWDSPLAHRLSPNARLNHRETHMPDGVRQIGALLAKHSVDAHPVAEKLSVALHMHGLAAPILEVHHVE